MTPKQIEQAREALSRAEHSNALSNYPALYEGMAEKGIHPDDVQPRVNVLTYRAWQAKGRQVQKGEHGVKLVTWIPVTKKDRATGEKRPNGKRPKSVSVFHISQTQPIAAE